MKRDYYGWATADFEQLLNTYSADLNQQCAPTGDTCTFDTARAVLKKLFEAYGDAHTNVRDPEGAERLREVMQDRAVPRTGLRTVRAEGGLLVVSVMSGSPAEQAGIQRFDLLAEVNGHPAGKRDDQDAEVGPNDFIRLERAAQPIAVLRRRAGTPDTALSLTTQQLRARDEPRLSWTGAGNKTALIDLPSFLADGTAQEFLKVVQKAQQQGAQQLVIDLRFNGGGSLRECVGAASVFGPVTYQMQQKGGQYSISGQDGQPAGLLNSLLPRSQNHLWNGPAAILVGKNTASCAEVFSFYAQGYGVTIVGENTKGVGNSGVVFYDLPDGGVVAVTILKAFDQNGRALPDHISPDVQVSENVAALTLLGRDTALEAALSVLNKSQAALSRP